MGAYRDLKIDVKNFMLRGSILKNTDWVIGVCAYTGKDTKIMKNAEDSKYKQSNIESKTNKLILLIFLFQVIICITISIFNWFWTRKNAEKYDKVIPNEYSTLVTAILSLGTIFVLTNSMIPISLIISLEMVKMAQAYFISMDEEMYMAASERYSKVFTSSLNEELGQIEFVFSDKTGTLTCNKMEFKMCMIGDEIYGDDSCLKDSYFSRKSSLKDGILSENEEADDEDDEGNYLSFKDKRLTELDKGLPGDKPTDLKLFYKSTGQEAYSYTSQHELVKEYFLLLSLCHDCVVEKDDNGEVRYQGESPDEIALVKTASQVGFMFLKNSMGHKELNILAKHTSVKQLQFFPFNSDRKRASIIVEHNGMIKLMIKGADSFIIERLGKPEDGCPQPYLEGVKKKLDIFSRKGLRTLCMAVRIMSKEEYRKVENAMRNSVNKEDTDKEIGKN